MPPAYVERGELRDLKELLLDDEAARRMYVWGMGGVGKSTLIQAALLADEVKEHYVNGVLWAELGPDAEPGRELRKWCKLLDLPESGSDTVWELAQRVENFLASPWRRFLIVLDDVWKAEDAEPLLVKAPGSRVLITTREKHVAQKLGVDDHIVELGPMTQQEAEALVRRRLGSQWSEQLRGQVKGFIDCVDGLPLALSIGASVVKQKALPTLAFSKPEGREDSLRLTIDASYECLPSGEEKEMFERLGMFSAGDAFMIEDALFYWSFRTLVMKSEKKASSIQERIADRLQELADLSLVLEIEPRKRYRMHALVGRYAAEKVESRDDADQLWYQFIENALDNLVMGTKAVLSLSPKGRRDLLRAEWPHIERAWQQAQVEDHWQQAEELGRDPTGRAMKWAEGFGLLGCQVLWRRREWKMVAAWSEEARELYREGYQMAYGGEPGGPVWRSLLIWSIDALFKQERYVPLPPLLDELREATSEGSPVWRLRYRVRRARYRLVKGDEGAAQEAVSAISVDARSLLNQGKVELTLHTLAEINMLLGDYASCEDQAAEAERKWRLACQRMTGCVGISEWGFDEWRLEQLIEVIGHWRASHGLWREAARLGQVWVGLRRWLGESQVDPLRWIGMWSLEGEDPQTVSWVLARLDALASEEEDTRLSSTQVTLRGFLAARREEWGEAEERLEEALEVCEKSPVCDESWVTMLNEAMERVKDCAQPSLPLRASYPTYEVPYDIMRGQKFSDWLGEALDRMKGKPHSEDVPFGTLMRMAEE